jgi:hypothetical protein
MNDRLWQDDVVVADVVREAFRPDESSVGELGRSVVLAANAARRVAHAVPDGDPLLEASDGLALRLD